MSYKNDCLEVLVARVERLEAQNRWLRLAAALLLLFGVSLGLMGAKSADRVEPQVVRASSVEAQEFILKSEEGYIYARLSLHPSNLTLREKEPKDRMYPIPRPEMRGQATLQFYNEKGELVWTAPPTPTVIPVK